MRRNAFLHKLDPPTIRRRVVLLNRQRDKRWNELLHQLPNQFLNVRQSTAVNTGIMSTGAGRELSSAAQASSSWIPPHSPHYDRAASLLTWKICENIQLANQPIPDDRGEQNPSLSHQCLLIKQACSNVPKPPSATSRAWHSSSSMPQQTRRTSDAQQRHHG